MAINAQSIIRRCVDTLQDTASVRWPLRELVRYLNDGQREIVVYRPDATVTAATFACAAGVRQTLPANAAKLINITHNTAGQVVRECSQSLLDANTPNWRAATPSLRVIHFVYDVRDPRTFQVYPPATSAASLELLYSAQPTDIAQPAEGAVITSAMTDADSTIVVGDLSVPDIYSNALQDYILYRAYNKDAEYAGNGERAQAHYAAFTNALGIEIKGTVATQPQTPSSAPVAA